MGKGLTVRVDDRSVCSPCYTALAGFPEPHIKGGRGFFGSQAYDGFAHGVCGLCGASAEDRITGQDARGLDEAGGASAISGCPPDGLAVTEFLESIARRGRN